MRAKLRLEHKIRAAAGGRRCPAATAKPGNSGNAVVALRDRLMAMGYLTPTLGMTYDGA